MINGIATKCRERAGGGRIGVFTCAVRAYAYMHVCALVCMCVCGVRACVHVRMWSARVYIHFLRFRSVAIR